jgi:hypothetical protein
VRNSIFVWVDGVVLVGSRRQSIEPGVGWSM